MVRPDGKVPPQRRRTRSAAEGDKEFDPPPWAEKLKLALRENSPGAKTGGRIKCPV
eukprot:COSAG01_NODE_67848_length_265_cov_12.445783_1_plen_55_part_01